MKRESEIKYFITNKKYMNYTALKSMIDSLIESYACTFCNETVWEENIDIIWAAWTTVNIDVGCPKCNKHSMIKVDVVAIDLRKMNITSDKLKEISRKLGSISSNSWNWEISNTSIKDEEIITLSKVFKDREFKVDDLFKK